MDDIKDINIELFTRCIDGSSSEEDKQELLRWINLSRENEHLYFIMKDIYEAGKWDQLSAEADTEAEFSRFKEKIGIGHLTVEGKKRNLYVRSILKYAAIFAIGIFSALAIQKAIKSSDTGIKQVWQTISTKQGMQTDFELPDSSHIWLNSGSSIQFPMVFTKGIREVRLQGEAFFNVKHDNKHPFIVNTGKLNVEVLGTTFNVSNYADENTAEVELASGKVNLFTGDWNAKKEMGELSPGQRAVYDLAKNDISITNVEINKYVAWKNGMLMFSGDPMDEVLKKIGRWFNVDFVIRDQKLMDYEFKATFKGESLTQVLDLLKLSSPIDYTIRNASRLNSGEFSKTIVYLKSR